MLWKLTEAGLTAIAGTPIGSGSQAYWESHVPLHFTGSFVLGDNGVATPPFTILGKRVFTLDVATAAVAPSIKIQGSFDGNTWTDIATATAAGTTTTTATHYYAQFRVLPAGLAGSESATVHVVVAGL